MFCHLVHLGAVFSNCRTRKFDIPWESVAKIHLHAEMLLRSNLFCISFSSACQAKTQRMPVSNTGKKFHCVFVIRGAHFLNAHFDNIAWKGGLLSWRGQQVSQHEVSLGFLSSFNSCGVDSLKWAPKLVLAAFLFKLTHISNWSFPLFLGYFLSLVDRKLSYY